MPTLQGGMMYECSTGKYLIGAAFMHHEDQWHYALKHYAVLEGLKIHMRNRTTVLTVVNSSEMQAA